MLIRKFSQMQVSDIILKDSEYFEIVKDIITNKNVLKMKDYLQHGTTTCYDHCLNVSYYSYILCKKLNLDAKSAARAGLLHDLFLYDWHTSTLSKNSSFLKKHAFYHPLIALKNSNKYFRLSKIEKDIIAKHMWPLTITLPKYKESYIVSFIDKICCLSETIHILIPVKIYI